MHPNSEFQTMTTDSILLRARELDSQDPLRHFRDEFHIPLDAKGNPQVYFVGNSLGLQSKRTSQFVNEVLETWQTQGVRGHFTGDFPWMPYHEFLTAPMARLVGAMEREVVMMNSLTANLHLMLASFYRPAGRKQKILIEEHAFPSDHYAVESHIGARGLDPAATMMVVRPQGPSGCFDQSEICDLIRANAGELALVLLPGVQYYTGQVFDIERLTRVARENGVNIGFDLAHAAGNLELKLHDWGPDFAVWCSYKYLNSGPGSVGGCFVHERHVADEKLPRLAGWWGHDKASRFLMPNGFSPIPTAEGWQQSNPPILSLAAIRASLSVFDQAGGMEPLRRKSELMTGFFVDLLREQLGNKIAILTPEPCGCQLSLRVVAEDVDGKSVKQALENAGMETDWREPDVIRAAPVPLYNRFEEIARFIIALKEILE